MSRNSIRVNIPRNMDKLSKLMKDILAKHIADGAGSPLNSLIDASFSTDFATLLTDIVRLQQMRKDAETLTESVQRRLGIRKGQKLNERNSIRFMATSVRDVLLGINLGQEQSLGDWGFEVNYSPRKKQQENPDA